MEIIALIAIIIAIGNFINHSMIDLDTKWFLKEISTRKLFYNSEVSAEGETNYWFGFPGAQDIDMKIYKNVDCTLLIKLDENHNEIKRVKITNKGIWFIFDITSLQAHLAVVFFLKENFGKKIKEIS